MNIEVTYFIAIINAILAVAVFYFARKKDTTDDAKASAEITTELKALRREMSEVKIEVSAMRQEWREDHDALQGLLREMSAMWKIIDSMKGERNND